MCTFLSSTWSKARLSGILYTLQVEPLLHSSRKVLRGLSLSKYESTFVLSAYADDIIVIVEEQNDVGILMKTLEYFKMLSAVKVDWAKSEAVLVGEWTTVPPKLPVGLSWKRSLSRIQIFSVKKLGRDG